MYSKKSKAKRLISKLKCVLLSALIAATGCAGAITASAATDNTARIYVTDIIYQNPYSEYFPYTPNPEVPTLTAKVGDIVEISLNITPTTDRKKFCSLCAQTFFGQSSASDYEKIIEDASMKFTNKYYDDGTVSKPAVWDGVSVAANPNISATSSDRACYLYNASSAYDICDFTNVTYMYKFTVEITKPGDIYVNSVLNTVAYSGDDGWTIIEDESAVEAKTSVSVVGHIDEELIKGDVDFSNELDITDATSIQKYSINLISFTDKQISVADVNGDGEINILDATAIQKILSDIA